MMKAGWTRRRLLQAALAIAPVAWLAGACSDGGESPSDAPPAGTGGMSDTRVGGRLTVYAAASLTDAFTEIAIAFEVAHPGVNVEFNFGGSPALRTQIEEGAPADVFASASTLHMDALVEAGLAAAPEIFVHNFLVVITPNDNPAGLKTLHDLATPDLKLVLAAAEVPAGGYARQMLANADADPGYRPGFSTAVLANLASNESNVKQVVAKVQLGEADASIVYSSDVTPQIAQELKTIEVPQAVNVIADYPIATLTEAQNRAAADAFVAFVLSAEGQAILAKWGFSTV
jgi:molybdate transport system substrate-binding protein